MQTPRPLFLTAWLAVLTLSVAGQSLQPPGQLEPEPEPELSWMLDEEEHHTLALLIEPAASDSFIHRPSLQFERNDGQTGPEVAFLSRGKGYHLFLTAEEAVLVFRSGAARTQAMAKAGDLLQKQSALLDPAEPFHRETRQVLRMQVVGANRHASVSGEEPLQTKVNYFKGNQPEKWRTNIPTFGKVRYREVYPGVDLVYYGHEGELEYDFVLSAGADPWQIQFAFEGAEEVRADENGELILKVAGREVRWRKPVMYQELGGVRREIAGSYYLQEQIKGLSGSASASPLLHSVSFELAAYDPALPLVIDPRLVYSTYLGGSASDRALSTAVDAEGNAFVAGVSASIDFPIKFPLYAEMAGGDLDVFVAKFNPKGELLFTTYLGGTGTDGKLSDLKAAVNAKGECLVVGTTDSVDFPVVKAVQEFYGGGGNDAFVTRLAPDGSALVTSTYFGGSDYDQGRSVAFGPDGDVYFVGATHSVDFPVTENAFQPELSAPVQGPPSQRDGFLVRFEPTVTHVVYSTYYGRSSTVDTGWDVTVDNEGSAYVVEWATCYGDCSETVLAKFSADGSKRLFEKRVRAGTGTLALMLSPFVAVSPKGRVFLAVATSSRTLSARNRPPSAPPGYTDVYVAQFDSSSGDSLGAVYLGGTGNDYPHSISVDSNGDLVVVGETTGPDYKPSNFPVTDPFGSLVPGASSDIFVTSLHSDDLAVTYSTVLGGPQEEFPGRAALCNEGTLLIPGSTRGDFPMANAYQPGFGGDADGFLFKLNLGERIKVTRVGSKLMVSWPSSANGFVLEQAESLSGATWSPVPGPATVEGNENNMSLEVGPSASFFRLRHP